MARLDSDNIKHRAEVKGPPEERGHQVGSFSLPLPILHGIVAWNKHHASQRGETGPKESGKWASNENSKGTFFSASQAVSPWPPEESPACIRVFYGSLGQLLASSPSQKSSGSIACSMQEGQGLWGPQVCIYHGDNFHYRLVHIHSARTY